VVGGLQMLCGEERAAAAVWQCLSRTAAKTDVGMSLTLMIPCFLHRQTLARWLPCGEQGGSAGQLLLLLDADDFHQLLLWHQTFSVVFFSQQAAHSAAQLGLLLVQPTPQGLHLEA
jgi:hypothetical protein